MMLIACMLGSGVALAASAAADVALPWWGQALVALSGAVVTFLLAQLSRALGKLFDYLAAKTRIAKLAEVDEIIAGFVAELAQLKVQQLKAAAADGKLSAEEIAELRHIPLEKLKEVKGIKFLTDLLGDQLETYVLSRVERVVTTQKSGTPANP